jgi:hypothetical protein
VFGEVLAGPERDLLEGRDERSAAVGQCVRHRNRRPFLDGPRDQPGLGSEVGAVVDTAGVGVASHRVTRPAGIACPANSTDQPLTDSNRRPPPYHALRNRCRGLPPVGYETEMSDS